MKLQRPKRNKNEENENNSSRFKTYMNNNLFEKIYNDCETGKLSNLQRNIQKHDIRKGLGLNIMNKYHKKTSRTCLYVACQNGHVDVVKELMNVTNIEKGWKVKGKCKRKKSPMEIALVNEHWKIVRELVKYSKDKDKLLLWERFEKEKMEKKEINNIVMGMKKEMKEKNEMIKRIKRMEKRIEEFEKEERKLKLDLKEKNDEVEKELEKGEKIKEMAMQNNNGKLLDEFKSHKYPICQIFSVCSTKVHENEKCLLSITNYIGEFDQLLLKIIQKYQEKNELKDDVNEIEKKKNEIDLQIQNYSKLNVIDEKEFSLIIEKFNEMKGFVESGEFQLKQIEKRFDKDEKLVNESLDGLVKLCEKFIFANDDEQKTFLEKIIERLSSVIPEKAQKFLTRIKKEYYDTFKEKIKETFDKSVKITYENFCNRVKLSKITLKQIKENNELEKVLFSKRINHRRLKNSYDEEMINGGFLNQNEENIAINSINSLFHRMEILEKGIIKGENVIKANCDNVLPFVKFKILERIKINEEQDPLEKSIRMKSIFVKKSLKDYDKEIILANMYKARQKSEQPNNDNDWKILKILEFKNETTKNEIINLLKLDHSSIMKIQKMFIFNEKGVKFIGIETDFYPTDILHWLKGKKGISNCIGTENVLKLPTIQRKKKIKIAFKNILKGLCYLKENNVEHCSIKTSNILINNENDLKIIGFEYCKRRIFEIYKSKMKSDILSFGEMLKIALVKSEDLNLDLKEIKQLKYLNVKEKDILSKLLEVKEITASDTLKHPFFYNWFNSDYNSTVREKELNTARKFLDHFKTIQSNMKMVSLNRSYIIEYFLNIFKSATNLKDLLCDIRVTFNNENGIDQGGLSRDSYSLFSTQLGESAFVEQVGKFYLPTDKEHFKEIYYSLGMLFCRCFLRKINLRVFFGPLFYSFLLDKPPKTVEDWILFCRIYIGVDFTRSMEDIFTTTNFEEKYEYPLSFTDLEGKDRIVCSKTKDIYIMQTIKNKLLGVKNRMLNIQSFKEGFFSLIKDYQPIIVNLLNCFEMEFLIFGKKKISVDDLRVNLKFPTQHKDGLKFTTYLMDWIDQSNNEQRVLFIQYLTGSNTLSYTGKLPRELSFNILSTMSKSFYAHTCFYSLDIASDFENSQEFVKTLNNYVNTFRNSGMYE